MKVYVGGREGVVIGKPRQVVGGTLVKVRITRDPLDGYLEGQTFEFPSDQVVQAEPDYAGGREPGPTVARAR